MKVVFVALGQEQLGISILSAVLRRAGHETSLVFDPALFHDRYYFDIPILRDIFDRDDAVVDEIVAEKPDLLAFSVLTFTYTWALDIARRAKERLGVPVIFGGVHPSAVPEVCLENDCVDYVCVGEGEDAIVRLCDELGRGVHRPAAPIPNLWWRDERGATVRGPNASFIQDIDSLPFWDKELWEDVVPIGMSYLTMTARGCPYRCTFCFNNFFAKLPGKSGGKYVRQRSVDRCLEELHAAKARYDIQLVDFEDDIFTLDKAWLREFLPRYEREIGVPFSCLVHPRFMDDDMARWLADAGCVRVQMGIQSADEEYKRTVLLRLEKDSHLERALASMAKAGLSMKLDHILGLPGEPVTAQEAARELYVRYRPARVNTYWLSYLPGTDITKDALREGRLTQADVDAIDRGDSRLFHYADSGTSPEAQSMYQKYDVLFRMLPLLPESVRGKLRGQDLPDLPPAVAGAIGFVCDLTSALRQRDQETMVYAKQYAYHLGRLLPGMIRGDKGAPPKRRRSPPPPPAPVNPPPRSLPLIAVSRG
ncbi:MAG: radical SAM protein [Minicystis sp.]